MKKFIATPLLALSVLCSTGTAVANSAPIGSVSSSLVPAVVIQDSGAQIASSSILTATSTLSEAQLEVKEEAEAFFRGEPILVDIAGCESGFRQFKNDQGYVLRGEVDPDDMGVMQINEHYQGAQAKALGYDLWSLDGNMGYAKYLYEQQGTQPWVSSEGCWGSASSTVSS